MSVSYLTTYPGILKIVQLLCNVVAIVILACDGYKAFDNFSFVVASIGGIVLTFALLVIKVFKVDRKANIHWARLEIGYCVAWTGLYIIAASKLMQLHNNYYRSAGVFGMLATITYVAEILERLAELKNGSSDKETAGKDTFPA